MIWKSIGQSVRGTSHISAEHGCEDAVRYTTINGGDGAVLICCASDGAGSAKYAALASTLVVEETIKMLSLSAGHIDAVAESDIYDIVEHIYDLLAAEASAAGEPLYEYSCTLLGCMIGNTRAIFFQVGDGAMVKNDGDDFYVPVFWPSNGEYQNTTSFIVDDRNLANLKIVVVDEKVSEVAVFTDGLQLLALNMEARAAHQPFFSNLFGHLRLADEPGKIDVLNQKLAEYLDSAQINVRTDDDKTLFLATRL